MKRMQSIVHVFATSRGCRVLSAFILLFATLVTATHVSGPDVITASAPLGGAPPAGSGTVRSSDTVRVLDGNTIITWINDKQTAIRLAGIDVAPYTTPCGAAATGQLWKLTKGGELTLEEDSALAFDSHGLRVYHALAKDGRAISQELVKAGVAKVNGKAEGRHLFAADEAQARTAQRGCLWSHGSPTAGVVDTARVEAAMRLDNGFRAAPAAPPAPDAAPLASSVLPTGFSVQTVAAGIDQPTGFAFVPDGRIFILGKHGLVWVVKNGTLLPTPLLDINTSVNDYADHGLLGIAVDPNFATTSPSIYLLYTYENNPANPTGPKTAQLARFTVTGDVANPASKQVLLGTVVGDAAHPSCDNFAVGADCIPTDELSHSIGSVRFAADGTLFVSTGDGASFNFVDDRALRSQNIDIMAGKLLHITTTGQGIATNPFANGSLSDNRSKVWAYGFRNPFRFTLRPGTNMPYVGDVGWDTWEEVNVATKGSNFGWPCYEGEAQQSGYAPKATCQTLYNQPAGSVKFGLVTYGHNVNGGYQPSSTAVIGGAFYTGTNYPAQYQGAYFYGDVQQFMRTLTVDANNALKSGPTDFTLSTDIPTDIQMGPDGNLYVCAIFTGELHRIVYSATAPVAQVAVDHQSGPPPLAVQFSSAGSSDPGGSTLSYYWDFGDGGPSTAANPSHTYTLSCGLAACIYPVTLTVTSNISGTSGTAGLTIGVGQPPTATITAPSGSLQYKVGDAITFSGRATDPLDGDLPPARLSWQVIVHHCPGTCHTHFLIQRSGVASGSFTIPDHGDNSYFEIILTATNSSGVTNTTSVSLHPQTVQVTLQTSPPGRSVVYDSTAYTAPHTFTSVIGSQHTITAPTSPGGLPFVSWSDGGTVQHNITIGTSDATYTATYSLPAPAPGSRLPASVSSTPPAPLPESRPPASISRTPPAPLPPSR